MLIPVDEYQALEETAEILPDEDTLTAIRRGLDDPAAGEVTSLDEVRAEHAARPRSSWRASFSPAPREVLAALDFLLADALSELERDPRLGHQLRGRLNGLRCYRVGVYRVIYELRDDRGVRVVAIRHRASAYDTEPR